jgi:hypothetical protein
MCGDLPSNPPVPNTGAWKKTEWKNRKIIKSNCVRDRQKEIKKKGGDPKQSHKEMNG